MTYAGDAGHGVHIVLAKPLDFIDDGVREVKEHQIVDEETNVIPIRAGGHG